MADYETLTITINADSGQAITSIGKLSNNLKKLNKTAQEVNTERVELVKGLLLDIASIDFTNVSKGLQDVVSAFKYFQNKMAQSVSPVFSVFDKSSKNNLFASQNAELTTYTKGIEKLVFDFEALSGAQKKVEESLELPTKSNELEDLSNELKAIGLDSKQLEIVFNAINNHVNELNPQQLEEVRNALKKAGLSAKEVDKLLKELGDSGEKAGNKTNRGFVRAFKNILKYRIIRKLIQSIFQEITNAFSQLANIDEDFNKSMGEIKSSFSFIARSLTSVIAPVIKALAPIFTIIAQAVNQISTTLGKAFAGALGQEQFAEATENIEDYNKALKKTQTLGIDELNVFQQEQDGFQLTDVNTQFEGFAEIFKEIKSVVNDLMSMVREFIEPLTKIFGLIFSIVKKIITLANDFARGTMADVGHAVSNLLYMLEQIFISVNDSLGNLMPILTPINTIISSLLNIVNSSLGSIFVSLGGILNFLTPIAKILSVVIVPPLSLVLSITSSLVKLLEALTKTLHDILTFRWSSIGNEWKRFASDIAEIWKEFGNLNNGSIGIEGFATGGFVEDGFFFANHNELIGSFDNGKTAVANNEQITQGIYQAVLQAMNDSNNGNGKEVVVNLDGYEVARVVTKRQNNFGQNLVVGGNVNYGK